MGLSAFPVLQLRALAAAVEGLVEGRLAAISSEAISLPFPPPLYCWIQVVFSATS